MKKSAPTSSPHSARFAGLVAGLLGLLAVPVTAQTSLYWDANGNGEDAIYGGDGTWNAANTVWNTDATIGSGSLAAWTDGTFANFLRGTTGNVTVVGTHQLARLTLGASTGSFTSGTTAYALSGGVLDIRHTGGAGSGHAINNNHGTNTVTSDVHLFGSGANASSNSIQVLNGNLTLGNVRNIATTGRTLQLISYSSNTLNITGNITKVGTETNTGLTLQLGSSGSGANYRLGGNNTGIAAISIDNGNLFLDNSNALGSSNLTVSNRTGASTVQVLIGVSDVTIARNVTFSNIPVGETTDIRAIGSNITSGTATFSGTIGIGSLASSGTGSALRVRSAGGGTTVFSGNITGGASSRVEKTEAGLVKFTRAAGTTYEGGTTVTTGALIVNNVSTDETLTSGTGNGSVTVSNNATFGGTGRSAGAITLAAGGRMSPGDMNYVDGDLVSSAGTFTAGASFTWNSNNTAAGMFFNLGADQASSDQLVVTGAFTKGTGSTFIFDFTGSPIDNSLAYTLVTFGSTTFTDGDFSAIGGGAGEFAIVGNTLVFGNLAAVPEPSALAALLGAATLAFGVAGRRRR